MADMESVIAGGAIALAGGALTQWLIHMFSSKRERHKLVREKAELICEEVENLVRWVMERQAKSFALKEDSVSIPPFGKLIALQALYFPRAETEVGILADKATKVIEAISHAYQEIARADLDIAIAKATNGDVAGAQSRSQVVSRDQSEGVTPLRNEFVGAGSQLTRRLVALVEEETRPNASIWPKK